MKNCFFLLFFPLLLASCQSSLNEIAYASSQNWKYRDLKVLDPVDADSPNQDLIALYTRTSGSYFQIRIDFLDLTWNNNLDIYIPIDTNPGGINQIITNGNELPVDINWEFLLIIPAVGNVRVIDKKFMPVYGMELLIVRDNRQDNVMISFNLHALPIKWNFTKLQILMIANQKLLVADKILPVSIDTPSPHRIEVLYLFWNTFTSSTPADTLRSWAGAHSGTMSTRHGLSYLLDAVEATNTPIILTDLLTPESLSALDYLHALPRISDLENKGLVGLPKVDNLHNDAFLPQKAFEYLYDADLAMAERWGISENVEIFDLFYLMNNNDSKYIDSDFNGDNDYAQLLYEYNCPLFTLNQVSVTNIKEISINCKSMFVSIALRDVTSPIILGGDFSKSLFGNPALSQYLFTFILNQPWIRILSLPEMQGTNATYIDMDSGFDNTQSNDNSSLIDSRSNSYGSITYSEIYEGLLKVPKNQITELATQVLGSLSQTSSSGTIDLRKNYVGQIGFIIEAAKWANNPSMLSDCSQDFDYDGQDECILANPQFFLAIEPLGGYMPFVFFKGDNDFHQIIGPTWEFILGLSDPSEWDTSSGVYSDPGQILGAMQNKKESWTGEKIKLIDNSIEISNVEMTMRKTFSILNDRIRITVHNSTGENSVNLVPLALDPWIRFSQDWGDKYYFTRTTNGFIWGINSNISVEMISSVPITSYSFLNSWDHMFQPEDPNFDYSLGHNLPYPLTVAEIQTTEDFIVDIIINP